MSRLSALVASDAPLYFIKGSCMPARADVADWLELLRVPSPEPSANTPAICDNISTKNPVPYMAF
ncbi:unnamed protein product [Periconia digitata]|uniref:Uncharacterized protein n=1 Tax=Periconia digitata TaxID=1303443 RepID=A0A9W4XVE7_9PLEO|nr:unnamed protein product [Periconia digitata]